jgi:hypothetical protein
MNQKHNEKGFVYWLFSLVLLVVFVGTGLFVHFRVAREGANTSLDLSQINELEKDETYIAEPAEVVDAIDQKKIPLGDGNVSSEPRVGYVMSCQTAFRSGGAMHIGDWVSEKTWDYIAKPHVQGDVSWPSANSSVSSSSKGRTIASNSLPNHSTGTFPISRSDPAYQYDTNPNSIKPQNINVTIPSNPTIVASPSCLPMGAIGFMLNGVAMYNALDAAGRDAAAHEVQDACDGHPQGAGQYHYHNLSSCLIDEGASSKLIGYALDGFGIYIVKDSKGNLLTNKELDECHGRTSEVEWNGKKQSIYHYVMTYEYPYSLGCFKGSAKKLSS